MRLARAGASTRARRRRAGRRAVLLPVLCTALAAAGAVACDPTTKPVATYAERVAAERRAKDAFFRTGAESPVPASEQAEFLPLAYFAIDEQYNAPAVLTPSEREPATEMPTSTGLRRRMRRAGTLRFSLKGRPLQLTAFVEAEAADMNRLFVPFGDLTNGTETYAAGRYIDLERTVSGLYEVDFNRAYHPYCFYNPKYDCPYPPPENRLQVPVRAGERARE